MPPRKKTPPLPQLTPEARSLMDAITRLAIAGHIKPGGGLLEFIKGKSPADVLAEADRLCGPAPAPKRRPRGRWVREAPSGSFEFEVSVRHIKPRIWRRFTLKSSETFLDLHEAIQDAGGWYNGHLFAFRDAKSGAAIAGLPHPEDTIDSGPFAGDVRLDEVFATEGGKRILYEYDFGDGWQVDVLCRAHIPDPAPWQRRLLAGARAFPPEDSGGPGGYEDCLEALAAEQPTEYQKERREWLGLWRPEAFDAAEWAKAFDRKKRKRTGNYEEEM